MWQQMSGFQRQLDMQGTYKEPCPISSIQRELQSKSLVKNLKMNTKKEYRWKSTGQDSQDKQNASKAGSSSDHTDIHGTQCTVSRTDPFFFKEGKERKRRKEGKESSKEGINVTNFLLLVSSVESSHKYLQ